MQAPGSELNMPRTECCAEELQLGATNESMKCQAGTIVAAEKGARPAMLVSIENLLLVNAAGMRLPACTAPPSHANYHGPM